MTAQQLTFDSQYRHASKRAKKGPQLARRMIALLAVANGNSMKRSDFKRYGLTERECRLGRAASHARIIQTRNGYKLLRDASPEEIAACVGNFDKQIKAMTREKIGILRRAHDAVNRGRKATA